MLFFLSLQAIPVPYSPLHTIFFLFISLYVCFISVIHLFFRSFPLSSDFFHSWYHLFLLCFYCLSYYSRPWFFFPLHFCFLFAASLSCKVLLALPICPWSDSFLSLMIVILIIVFFSGAYGCPIIFLRWPIFIALNFSVTSFGHLVQVSASANYFFLTPLTDRLYCRQLCITPLGLSAILSGYLLSLRSGRIFRQLLDFIVVLFQSKELCSWIFHLVWGLWNEPKCKCLF